MSEYSKDTIRDLISFLVAEGYIKSIGDKYPVLTLDIKANDVLFSDKQVVIKKKIERILKPEKNSKNDLESLHFDSNLFDILRELRMEVSKQNNVPPFIIFADVSLKQMSTYYPTDVDSMLKISGVGTFKLEKYGDVFIDAIRNYVQEHNIKKQDIIEKPKVKSEPTPKTDTKLVSYELYTKDGKSIKEIAEIRGLTERTIEQHLLHCFQNGMDIDLESLVNSKFENEIYEAINKCRSGRLRKIKDMVSREVSYFDIKYYVVKMKNT